MDLAALASYYDTPASSSKPGRVPAIDDTRPASTTARDARAAVRKRMPAKATLDYTNAAITAFVLVLALPWLLRKLATNPADVIAAAGRKTVAK